MTEEETYDECLLSILSKINKILTTKITTLAANFQFYPRSTIAPRDRILEILPWPFNSIQDQRYGHYGQIPPSWTSFQFYPRSTRILREFVHACQPFNSIQDQRLIKVVIPLEEVVMFSILSKINSESGRRSNFP